MSLKGGVISRGPAFTPAGAVSRSRCSHSRSRRFICPLSGGGSNVLHGPPRSGPRTIAIATILRCRMALRAVGGNCGRGRRRRRVGSNSLWRSERPPRHAIPARFRPPERPVRAISRAGSVLAEIAAAVAEGAGLAAGLQMPVAPIQAESRRIAAPPPAGHPGLFALHWERRPWRRPSNAFASVPGR